MSRYIDAHFAQLIADEELDSSGRGTVCWVLAHTPTADVVNAVRCKDCVYCCISTDPKTNISIQKCGYVGFNPVQSSQVSDDFYCSYGERRKEDG